MKKLKNKLDHILAFYRKTKKRIFKKIMIVATCIVCTFAPIYDSYTEVHAFDGGVVEGVAVGGILAFLALCGATVSDTVGADGLANACYNVADGFKNFAKTLPSTVAKNLTNFMDATMETGKVALDTFNSYGQEIGHAMYNIFNTSNGNSYVGDLNIGENIIDYANFNETDVFTSANPSDMFPNNDWAQKILKDARSAIVLVTTQGLMIASWNVDTPLRYFSLQKSKDSRFYSANACWGDNVNNLDYSSISFNRKNDTPVTNILASIVTSVFMAGNSVALSSDGTTALKLGNKWVDPLDTGLELDPPWINKGGTNTDLKLLDNSYINYGDINDVVLPRYVGYNATATKDGVISNPGTWSIPNDYLPNLERPLPIPLPLPLPDVGTVDKGFEGDITKDTPIENTDDKVDTEDPSYKPPVVGDLPNFKIPAVIDWKEYFPFCIPFDLIKFIGVLAAEPQTPKFSTAYNLYGHKGTINIDLKDFDGVASVCRTLFDLLFVIGLLTITRSQIKG